LGSKEYWELSKNLPEEEDTSYDPNAKKKNVQQIQVKKSKW